MAYELSYGIRAVWNLMFPGSRAPAARQKSCCVAEAKIK